MLPPRGLPSSAVVLGIREFFREGRWERSVGLDRCWCRDLASIETEFKETNESSATREE